MSSKTVWEIGREWWAEVAQKVKRAVVFMDARMAEFMHWSGGMALLLQAGALDVRDFSSFESGQESHQKAVFVISSALTSVTESVLRDIVTGSSFQYVVVFTTVSPLLHPHREGEDWEGIWEETLLQWMGNMNYTVEVRHLPLFAAEVCPQLFITLIFSGMFPLTTADIRQVAYQHSISAQISQDSKPVSNLSSLELSHLPSVLQSQIQEMSSGLHALLQGLDVREDIYSVGHTARLVATQLDLYPPARTRRKNTQNRASLILIDRSLDLAPVLTYQAETLLDRLTYTLPCLAGHYNDRMVDMTPLTNVKREVTPSSQVILPGNLATSSPVKRPAHLTPLIVKKHKEAVMEVNRKLVEVATAEKLPLNLGGSRPGRVSADLLDSTLALFRGNYSLVKKHLDILQVAMATSQCLRKSTGQASQRTDAIVAAEKNLLQTMVDGMESGGGLSESTFTVGALSTIVDREMTTGADDREITIDDFLCLLTLTYTLSGGECGPEEEVEQLKDKLADWILKDSADLPPVARKIFGDQVTESILRDQVECLWERLEGVGAARDDLSQFSSVLDPGDAVTPASTQPLLTQIINAILDPSKPDLPDVECKSGGLGNLLKSGFGFFTGSGKPRPGDAPLLILYVIGGVTSSEVKQVKDIVDKAAPQFDIMIGSTRLASIESTLESVFVTDNVNVGNL